jgi:hypothetical protein
MPAKERLALINAKAERAYEHVVNLNSEIDAFRQSDPYKIDTKRDPKTRRLIYYIAEAKARPARSRHDHCGIWSTISEVPSTISPTRWFSRTVNAER